MLWQMLSGLITSFRQSARTDPLSRYFRNNPGRLIDKWNHYFEIYHRHFARFRNQSPIVIEIGVFHGGSLQMWRDYFGPGARIVGIDVSPACQQFEDDATTILIGDQADRGFLAEVRARFPVVDIVIDDGGHTMVQQITTFEELYAHVQPHGVYLCEDLHTSYFPDYGGGLRREGSFIEFSKTLIDRLHAWSTAQPGQELDPIAYTTYALHFYESIMVVEKRPIDPPRRSQTGRPSF